MEHRGAKHDAATSIKSVRALRARGGFFIVSRHRFQGMRSSNPGGWWVGFSGAHHRIRWGNSQTLIQRPRGSHGGGGGGRTHPAQRQKFTIY